MLAYHGFQEAVQPKVRFSEREFLLMAEAEPEGRLEFHQGYIYAMAGATVDHSLIERNLSRQLDSCLEKSKKGCGLLRGLYVATAITDFYLEPDLMVVCGPLDRHPRTKSAIMNPRVIIEILSPSTEAFDRNEKLNAYKRFQSLTQYIMISQHQKRIEVLPKDGGEFGPATVLTEGELIIEGCTASLEDIYRDVALLA